MLRFSRDSFDLSLFLLIIGIFSSSLIEALHRQQARLRQALQVAETRAEDRRASDERFSVVFHTAPVVFMIARLSDGHLVDVNSAFVELWGYVRAEALGRTSAELRLWIEPAHLIQKLRENRHSDAQEVEIRHKSGQVRRVLVSVRLIQFEASAHLLITAADVTERDRAREMEHVAHHDTLTNLPNRLLLQAKLREALDRTRAARGSRLDCRALH